MSLKGLTSAIGRKYLPSSRMGQGVDGMGSGGGERGEDSQFWTCV